MPTPFRRHFHRPSEIVIGYDEQVVSAAALRKVRAAWGGEVAVRTMPFNRAEPDPSNALMIALGEVGAGGVRAPSPSASAMIASALAAATPVPWRFGLRFDQDGVIVRGTVESRTTEALAASLLELPALATTASAVIEQWRDEGLQLITARWDDRARGRWVIDAAHGFKGDKWVRTVGPDGAPDVAR